MSGAKVVRIVTREELEAQCRSLLRSVDAAHTQFERFARKNGAWNREMAEALRSRRQALQGAFERESWAEVRTQAPAETAFLRSEVERLTEGAIRKAEMARRKRRRYADSARSLIAALEAAGRQAPESLRLAAERANRARDEELPAIEAELNAGFALFGGAGEATDVGHEAQSLAERLMAGEQQRSYAGWLEQVRSGGNASDQRLDRLIAEIEVLSPETAAPFGERAAAISLEGSADRRALLTDSLTLDLAAHLAAERAWQSMLAELEEARATLQTLQAGAALGLIERIDAAVAARHIENAGEVLNTAHRLAETETSREASRSRRRAVLQGLASLGYELREGMAADWAKSGRIVVRKPAVADYGVEIGAVAAGVRMQVRVVGSAHPVEPRSADRDRDAEVRWCSQVGDLQSVLAAAGSELTVERALPPGAQALKSVEFGDSDMPVSTNDRRTIAKQIG